MVIVSKKKGRPRKPRKPRANPVIICGLCQEWGTAPTEDKSTSGYTKICPISHKPIKYSSPVCERFIPTTYFFCLKEPMLRIHRSACLARQSKKLTPCKKCKLGRVIKLIDEQENAIEHIE